MLIGAHIQLVGFGLFKVEWVTLEKKFLKLDFKEYPLVSTFHLKLLASLPTENPFKLSEGIMQGEYIYTLRSVLFRPHQPPHICLKIPKCAISITFRESQKKTYTQSTGLP